MKGRAHQPEAKSIVAATSRRTAASTEVRTAVADVWTSESTPKHLLVRWPMWPYRHLREDTQEFRRQDTAVDPRSSSIYG